MQPHVYLEVFKHTVNALYFVCMIFVGLSIFCFFSMDLIWIFVYTFVNAYLAIYLISQRDMTAKDAKRNTSPNVICLQ